MTAREVELSGGAPWGFRMHGGADHNQPLRISRVNPGRKASLCGIREGDVISGINGRPTRTMTNADAHAMLRCAGPVLRLGLNEDREVSPRRRSIGKGSDLKRPSQLAGEIQSGRAIPQAPVYATIRPSQSPQNRPSSSMRCSLNSLPLALNSTPLVRSVDTSEEQPRFHPTNPFYTTLPSNYSSASKLPVPNGKASLSTLDRNKPKDNVFNEYSSDLKSPSLFTRASDSGPNSLPYSYSPCNDTPPINGHNSGAKSSDKDDYYNRKFEQFLNLNTPNVDKINNPFDTKRNSDPFEKYLRPENKINGSCDFDIKTMPSSMSDSNFRSSKETKSSTITEHKISEIEEVKTIKKIILNGRVDSRSNAETSVKSPMNGKMDGFDSLDKHFCSTQQSPGKERILSQPNLQRSVPFSTAFEQKGTEEKYFTSLNSHRPTRDGHQLHTVETCPAEVLIDKPPVISPTPGVPSPTTKREYTNPT